MISFKEWVQQKTEEATGDERVSQVREWIGSCDSLLKQLASWLAEEGDGKVVFVSESIGRNEGGLGYYSIPVLTILVGDESAKVVPMGRHVFGSFGLPGEPQHRGVGRVDVTDGGRKYMLYRTVQEGRDVWYVDDERGAISLLTKERFLEIVMDLMS